MELKTEQVRRGYKLTEVGVIPEDWDVDFIENLAYVTTGSKNTQDRIEDGQYPFFVRSQIVERINTYSFDGEAVLTAGDGVGTGKVFHYINGKFDAHQRVYRISNFKEKVKGYFFYLYFSTRFYDRIMQMTAKSSVDSVRREMISRMLIPFPRQIEEQEAICAALKDIDSLIASLDALIQKKRDIKQGAMQELLTGKRRLPGFHGEWITNKLGDNSTLKARIGWQGLTTAEYLSTGDYYLITGTDFADGKIKWSNCAFVDKTRYAQDLNIQVRSGDILVTKDGTIGKVAYLHNIPKPATLNSGVFVIRPKMGAYVPKFVYYIFCSEVFTGFLNRLAAGSTINHLYQKDFVHFEFMLPPSKEEQTAIATYIADLDEEINALTTKRIKLADIKIAMMQQLLTGSTRLV